MKTSNETPRSKRGATRTASFRLTNEARNLLAALAAKKGIMPTAALEIIIREAAKREKISQEEMSLHAQA